MGGVWRMWVVMASCLMGAAVSIHVNFNDNNNNHHPQDSEDPIRLAEAANLDNPISLRDPDTLEDGAIGSDREERMLILLAEISPDQCRTSNNTNSLGTCLPAGDCTQRGGSSSGTCANGLGVCCLITRTCNGATSLNNTYFRNPSTGSSELGACTLTINRVSKNICQVRLDFLQMELSQPDIDGVCLDDFMTVTGGVSPVPMVCGVLTGQHMYYDLDPKGGAVKLTVDRASTTSLSSSWNVQITQISCNSKFRAPVGCLQYFTETTNTINSFNFLNTNTFIAGTRQVSNLDYSVCIRRSDNYCGITWEMNDVDGPFAFTIDSNADVVNSSMIGTSFTSTHGERCVTDYVVIPGGVFRNVQDNNVAIMSDRFCGLGFPDIVRSTAQPFTLYVKTDSNETQDSGNRGFSLTYRQTTTCT